MFRLIFQAMAWVEVNGIVEMANLAHLDSRTVEIESSRDNDCNELNIGHWAGVGRCV